jgi:hypothetical protein
LAFILKASPHKNKLLPAYALLIATVLATPAFAAIKTPAVLLKEHSEMQGDVDILVGKTGFSMLFRKSKMALIMGAPQWNVVYANLSNKRYYQCKPTEWKVGPAVFSAMFRPSSPTSLRLTTSKKTKHKGLPCEVFKMETREASRGTDKTWKRLMPKDGSIWLYPQAGFPRPAYLMVSNLLAIPSGPGIPVAMEFSRYDGDKINELILYGFENKQTDDTEFAVPKGFTRVKDQASVLNKAVESKDFADFLDEK